MAASASFADNVTALIECSLCLSTFNQPKCLPCVHTFCLDCLQKYMDQNKIRESLPCPLCRQMCDIPPQGLSSLRDNFFIQRMVDLEKKTEIESEPLEVKCDLCLDPSNVDNCPIAEKFCPECNENLCQTCTTYHKKMKATKSHPLVLLNDKLEDPVKAVKMHSRTCDKHSNQPMHLYCLKCDVCMCVSCMLAEHNEHKCEDINDAFSRYQDQFDNNISALHEALNHGYTSIQDLKSMEDAIINETSQNEEKIRERCDELRKILAGYEEELLSEARTFKERRVKEINGKLDEVEFQNLHLDSFIKYLKELKEKGSKYDVACSGKDLVSRAKYLLTSSRDSFTAKLIVSHMTFCPGNEISEADLTVKLIGELLVDQFREKLLITLGLDIGESVQQKICQISLVKPDTINVTNFTAANVHGNDESAACVISNVLYAVSVGADCNELWKWSASRDEWKRRAYMPSSRGRYCVTSVGDKIYVLGGYSEDSWRTLRSIICYDIKSNKWSEAGKLRHAVQNATCVTYELRVYVFGGRDENDTLVDYVQVYDPATGIVSLGSKPMPRALNRMRSVLWKSKALLIGYSTCYIYDFESDTWQERKRFKTNVNSFGLTLDDNTLYISGGGAWSDDVWTCTDEVKSLSVDDFISTSSKSAEWKHHATLPAPASISAYSNIPIYYTRTNSSMKLG